MLPVPTARHTPKSAGTRAEIEKRSLNLLQPGSTTREEMLWEFGEPDLVSEDERWFLYRWLSVGGYVAVAVYGGEGDIARMGTRRSDMAFEFDDRGVLVRFGNIETLITQPIGDNTAIDATLPMNLSVLHRSSTSDTWYSATLRLDEDGITLQSSAESREIPTVAITHLEHRADHHSFWHGGSIAYRMHYRDDDGSPAIIRLQLDALDVLRLAKYLQSRNPAARITD